MADENQTAQTGGEAGGNVSRIGLVVLGLALAAAVSVIAYKSLPDSGEAQIAEAENSDGPLSIEELEQRAKDNPEDVATLQELGFARFERGEFADSVTQYEKAVSLDESNAVLWSSLGEARVMASEREPLPANALEAFERALALDPDDPRARYFLAVSKDLSGDHQGAIGDWLALLEDTPPGAPWESDLTRTIEQVGKTRSIDTDAGLAKAQEARAAKFAFADDRAPASGMEGVPPLTAGAAIPGPTDEQIAAARTMAPSDQRQMAESMVARLEGRLASEPNDIDGWVMLMRSRMALEQSDLAVKALSDAKAANPSEASRLDAEAEVLGVR
jgi:cytochrome c-type biogenesis protein CcmH